MTSNRNPIQYHQILSISRICFYLTILNSIIQKQNAILTDAKNQTTRFEYDLANKMTKETRPMNQTIEYTYYANGLLKTVKDSKGQITTYTYDAANRLIQITYADGKQDTFAYDAVGNMTSYTKDSVSGTMTYDALNRRLSETVNYGPFSKTYSYSYDALSNKATYTSPEGKTYAYTYNKNNQPTSIVFDGKTIGLTYQWNRLTKATLPNNVITDYQYNANSWLNYITTRQGTTTHLDKKYDFDKVGNITKKTDDASIVTDYNFDSTYQLTSSTNPSLAETFTYDKTGNRLIAVLNSSTINYTHNTNNEMTSAGAVSYSYDQNGNTIQETNGTQITKYVYNTSNRLERVELPDGRIAEYKYDPFGRRISKTVNNQTTYYLYSDEGLIGEYDSAGNNIKSYGWVPDSIWGTNPVFMLENNNYYFYHNDHLGTPQKMTDETGNVVWSATYTVFGEATVDPTSTITNNLRFAGQYFDEETGKHYNWNRYYDPKTGRYTQVDPIGFAAGDANFYRYVFNSSVNFIDPLGLYDSCLSGRDDQPIPLGCQIRARAENKGPVSDLDKAIGAAGVDFIPGIGDAKGLFEVFTGEDILTGEKLGNWRYLGLLGISELRNIRQLKHVEKLNKAAKAAETACNLAKKGKSVIGPRDTYVAFAKKIGANFLDLKGKPWTEYENMKYLYGIIERGDDVYFAGKFDPLKLRGPSALRDEINFLQRYGYEWTSDFTKMIKR